MADEKSKIVTDATGPDAGLAPVQPEAGGGTPAPKQEQTAPEAVSPDKATAPEQVTPTQPEKGADAPKEQKAASVSVFNFRHTHSIWSVALSASVTPSCFAIAGMMISVRSLHAWSISDRCLNNVPSTA